MKHLRNIWNYVLVALEFIQISLKANETWGDRKGSDV